MIKQLAAAVVCLGVAAGALSAAEIPAVGDKAPDFTLQELAGKDVTLSQLTAEGPVVLVVLRGWPGYQCPICFAQVAGLLKKANEIASDGAHVVLVYPGPAERLGEHAAEFMKSKSLPAHFLYVTDPDYKFTDAYGLRWDAPRETAYPSTFVIDPGGVVRFATVSKTHGGRAKVDDVLAALASAK